MKTNNPGPPLTYEDIYEFLIKSGFTKEKAAHYAKQLAKPTEVN